MRTVTGWVAMIGIATLVVVPVMVVLWSIVEPDVDTWQRLWDTRLPGMLRDTALLLTVVVSGALVLGTGLAWLVTAYDFPGRRVLGWVVVVPLAMPGYVLGFVWLETLEGPLGARAVRSVWLCAATLTLTLYPYVYLMARAAFGEQSSRAVDGARSLGCSRAKAFWRVTLPMARPSLAAGAALVAMEVLTDVGTVRLFGVSTIADGVFRVWFGSNDRDAAAELAVLLVVIAVMVIGIERVSRGRARFTQASGDRRRAVSGRRTRSAFVAAIGAWVVVGLAVVVPVARLTAWTLEARRSNLTVTVAGDLPFHAWSSIRVAVAATGVCLVFGVVLAVGARRRGRLGRVVATVATVGYAVPGPVVAVGVVITLAALDRQGWMPDGVLLVGSFVGLIYALVVRFVAVGFHGVDASLGKVPPNAVASARTLGASAWRATTRVEVPIARAGLYAATALVAIDTLKELPVTLLLRPFGVETLSVWVWQATSESLWTQAAVPSLALVGLGLVPVAVLLNAIERGAEVAS
jgi:iron(III) transport system permease protein